MSAIVLDIDRHLALLRFPDPISKDMCTDMNCSTHQHCDEWIYRGSLRFRSLNEGFGQSFSAQQPPSITTTTAVDNSSTTTAAGLRRRFHRRQFEYMAPIDTTNSTYDIVTIDDEDDEHGGDNVTQYNKISLLPNRMQTARKSTSTQPWTKNVSGDRDTNERVSQQIDHRALELAQQRQNQFQIINETIEYVELNVRDHEQCSDQCIIAGKDAELNDDRFKHCSPFIVPLMVGWKRQIAIRRVHRKQRKSVYYVAPCGRRLRSLADIAIFLKCSHSQLTIDLFTFDALVRPIVKAVAIGELVMEDYSHGFENIPISVVNTVDDDPVQVIDYKAERFAAPGVNLRTSADDGFCSGCSCTGKYINS